MESLIAENNKLREQNQALRSTLRALLTESNNFFSGNQTNLPPKRKPNPEKSAELLDVPDKILTRPKDVQKKLRKRRSTSDTLVSSVTRTEFSPLKKESKDEEKLFDPQKTLPEERDNSDNPRERSSNRKSKSKSPVARSKLERPKRDQPSAKVKQWTTMQGKNAVALLFPPNSDSEFNAVIHFVTNFVNQIPPERRIDWYHGSGTITKHGEGKKSFFSKFSSTKKLIKISCILIGGKMNKI
jgi:hypothetical protein